MKLCTLWSFFIHPILVQCIVVPFKFGKIKLFVKMSNFLEIICLKCWNSHNFKKRKTLKIGGNLGGFFFNLVHHCNASFQKLTTILYPIGWWNIISPHFFIKIQKFCKMIAYSRNSWRSYNNKFFPKYLYFQSSYLKAPFNSSSKSLFVSITYTKLEERNWQPNSKLIIGSIFVHKY